MHERDIEAKVIEWWGPGRLQLKLNVMGRRGWPDRLFICPKGRAVFIEFKLPGEKPRPLQEYIHRKLSEMGFEIYVCDNVEDAKRALGS